MLSPASIVNAIGGSTTNLLERYVLKMYAEVVHVARRAHNSKESGKMASQLNELERSSSFVSVTLCTHFLISAII